MKFRAFVLAGVCAALMAAIRAQVPVSSVEQWDTLELAFTSTIKYSNPFADVSLRVTFTNPSGRTITVDGFYDGDATWRARFMALQLGSWTYRTISNDSALNGRGGSINCIPAAHSDGTVALSLNPGSDWVVVLRSPTSQSPPPPSSPQPEPSPPPHPVAPPHPHPTPGL